MKKMVRISIMFFTVFFLCSNLSADEWNRSDPEDLKGFTSDKCSLFPNGTFQDKDLWCECCFEHDISYWQGGTKAEREKADRLLGDCVAKKTNSKFFGNLMYLGVRFGGSSIFPTWYRWGYGWPYGRGYLPVTEEEVYVIGQLLDEYFASDNPYICED